MAVYDNTTPQANQNISDSQPIILSNFQYLQTMLGIEHQFTTNTATAGDGRHKTVSMPDQGGDPAVPAGTTGILYNKAANLFFNNGANITQLTGHAVVTSPTIISIPLPGGALLQAGKVTAGLTHQTDTPLTFIGLGGQNFTTQCYGVWTTAQRNGGAPNNVDVIYINAISTTGFTYRNTSNAGIDGFYWLAIGI